MAQPSPAEHIAAARPIPAQLWRVIQEERARLQADGYSGKLVIEFDVLDGQERRVRVLAAKVGEIG